MELLGFIIWIGGSLLVGKWNASRGNSFVTAMLVSLFCTPVLGVIVVLLQEPNTKTVEQSKIQDGDMKKCPSCAELIKKEAKKCRYCGQDL